MGEAAEEWADAADFNFEAHYFGAQGRITLLNNNAYPLPRKQTLRGRTAVKTGIDTVTYEELGTLTELDLNSTDSAFYPDIDKDFSHWNKMVIKGQGIRKVIAELEEGQPSQFTDFLESTPTTPAKVTTRTFLENEEEFWTLVFFLPGSAIFPFPEEGALAELMTTNPTQTLLHLVSFAYFRAYYLEKLKRIEDTFRLRRNVLEERVSEAKEKRNGIQAELNQLENQRQILKKGTPRRAALEREEREKKPYLEAAKRHLEEIRSEVEVERRELVAKEQRQWLETAEVIQDIDLALSAPEEPDPNREDGLDRKGYKTYRSEYLFNPRYTKLKTSPRLQSALSIIAGGMKFMDRSKAEKIGSLALCRSLRTMGTEQRNLVAEIGIVEMNVTPADFAMNAELLLASLNASCVFETQERSTKATGIPSHIIRPEPGGFLNMVYSGENSHQLYESLAKAEYTGGVSLLQEGNVKYINDPAYPPGVYLVTLDLKNGEKKRSLYIAPPMSVAAKTALLNINIGNGESKLGLTIQDVTRTKAESVFTPKDKRQVSFVSDEMEDTEEEIIPAMIVKTSKNADPLLEKNTQIVSVNGTATPNAATAIQLIEKARKEAATNATGEAVLTIEVSDPFFNRDQHQVKDVFLSFNSTSTIETKFYVLTTFFEKDFIRSSLEFRYKPNLLSYESKYPTFPGAIETRYRIIRLCKWINPALGAVVLPPTESFIAPLDGTKLNYSGLQYYSGCVPRFAVIAPTTNSGCEIVTGDGTREADYDCSQADTINIPLKNGTVTKLGAKVEKLVGKLADQDKQGSNDPFVIYYSDCLTNSKELCPIKPDAAPEDKSEAETDSEAESDSDDEATEKSENKCTPTGQPLRPAEVYEAPEMQRFAFNTEVARKRKTIRELNAADANAREADPINASGKNPSIAGVEDELRALTKKGAVPTELTTAVMGEFSGEKIWTARLPNPLPDETTEPPYVGIVERSNSLVVIYGFSIRDYYKYNFGFSTWSNGHFDAMNLEKKAQESGTADLWKEEKPESIIPHHPKEEASLRTEIEQLEAAVSSLSEIPEEMETDANGSGMLTEATEKLEESKRMLLRALLPLTRERVPYAIQKTLNRLGMDISFDVAPDDADGLSARTVFANNMVKLDLDDYKEVVFHYSFIDTRPVPMEISPRFALGLQSGTKDPREALVDKALKRRGLPLSMTEKINDKKITTMFTFEEKMKSFYSANESLFCAPDVVEKAKQDLQAAMADVKRKDAEFTDFLKKFETVQRLPNRLGNLPDDYVNGKIIKAKSKAEKAEKKLQEAKERLETLKEAYTEIRQRRANFNFFVFQRMRMYESEPDGGTLPATLLEPSARTQFEKQYAIMQEKSPWHSVCVSARTELDSAGEFSSTPNRFSNVSRANLFSQSMVPVRPQKVRDEASNLKERITSLEEELGKEDLSEEDRKKQSQALFATRKALEVITRAEETVGSFTDLRFPVDWVEDVGNDKPDGSDYLLRYRKAIQKYQKNAKQTVPLSHLHYRTDPLEYLGAALQLQWYAAFWKKLHDSVVNLTPRTDKGEVGTPKIKYLLSLRANENAAQQDLQRQVSQLEEELLAMKADAKDKAAKTLVKLKRKLSKATSKYNTINEEITRLQQRPWLSEYIPGGIENNNEFLAYHKWYTWCSDQMLNVAAEAEKAESKIKEKTLMVGNIRGLLGAFFEKATCSQVYLPARRAAVVYNEDDSEDTREAKRQVKEEEYASLVSGFHSQFVHSQNFAVAYVFFTEQSYKEQWPNFKTNRLIDSEQNSVPVKLYAETQSVVVKEVESRQITAKQFRHYVDLRAKKSAKEDKGNAPAEERESSSSEMSADEEEESDASEMSADEEEESDASEMSADEERKEERRQIKLRKEERRQIKLGKEERKERLKKQSLEVANDNIIMVYLKLEIMDSLRDDKEVFASGVGYLIAEIQTWPGVYVLDPFIVEQLRGKPECTVWNHALMKLLYNDGADELKGHGVLGLTVKKAYRALSTLPLAGKAIQAQRNQLERIHLRGYTLANGKEIPHEKPV